MCTLIVLRRPGHQWPLLVVGNRDEMRDRPWSAPGRHWDDRPEVVAGLDRLGGGSWFGLNDSGVVAAVMNREGTLGPEPGKRSRGELVLLALDFPEATDGARALAELDPKAYRPFNLFVGDPAAAFWLRHAPASGAAGIEVLEVGAGLHMLTAQDLDDPRDPRIRLHLPRFREAAVPEPAVGDWAAWQSLLGERYYSQHDGPHAALNLGLPGGFGTVCSQIIAVPRHPGFGPPPVFLFAGGPPDRARFEPVAL
jgi:Transport and Golgi organisation 2